jgi:nucleolar GTP-binding protein
MFDIPTILTPDEILNKAFSMARKVQVKDPNYRFRMQKLSMAKMNSAASVIDSTLHKYVKAFPSFNDIPPFYMALIDLLFSLDDIKRSLGRIDGARRTVMSISAKTNRQIRRTGNTDYMSLKVREGYGRISSVVEDLRDDLDFLARVREQFKGLPGIPTSYPTAVIAGYPSVGKSQLISRMSTAKPKVATYPFTTRELIVGYFNEGPNRYQLIDTPGLLDRPFEERNPVEKQAILALTLLSNVCVFMVDPTGHCGYPLEPQVELLGSIFNTTEDMNFIVVVNKSDLMGDDADLSTLEIMMNRMGDRLLAELLTSALTGDGIKELRELLVEALKPPERGPWEDFESGE